MLSSNYKRVIAIEPESNNMRYLRRIIMQAGLKNIKPIQIAISDNNGYVNLYLSRHAGGHTIKKGFYENSIKVKATTLDMLLKNESCIDLIKVDVEGAELQVIKGAQKIMPKIKSWMIELHNSKERKALEKHFMSEGYKLKWIDKKHIFASR